MQAPLRPEIRGSQSCLVSEQSQIPCIAAASHQSNKARHEAGEANWKVKLTRSSSRASWIIAITAYQSIRSITLM